MKSIMQMGSELAIRRTPRSELPPGFEACGDESARLIELPDDLSPDADLEYIAHEYFEIANDRLTLSLDHRQIAAVAVLAVELAKQTGREQA